jgi:hypothetical protein
MAGIQEPIRQGGSDRALVRDAALLRISRTRRWMLAGAAVLTAGLAALASALLPGKSFGAGSKGNARNVPATAANPTVTPALPAPANADQLGLQPPGQAPQSVPAPQPAPAPQPSQPAPATQPAPSSGGGAVVSGGS